MLNDIMGVDFNCCDDFMIEEVDIVVICDIDVLLVIVIVLFSINILCV